MLDSFCFNWHIYPHSCKFDV